MTVIVKGNKFEAAKAAAKRGIPFVFRNELIEYEWTVGEVSQEFRLDVMKWLGELPHNPPFPTGSCLSFNFNTVSVKE
jgi:hypothetical protein